MIFFFAYYFSYQLFALPTMTHSRNICRKMFICCKMFICRKMLICRKMHICCKMIYDALTPASRPFVRHLFSPRPFIHHIFSCPFIHGFSSRPFVRHLFSPRSFIHHIFSCPFIHGFSSRPFDHHLVSRLGIHSSGRLLRFASVYSWRMKGGWQAETNGREAGMSRSLCWFYTR